MSAGALCLNVLIAANAHGYVSNWLTEWFAFDTRAYPLLGVSREGRGAGWIYSGGWVSPPVERPRPDLAEIVSWVGGSDD